MPLLSTRALTVLHVTAPASVGGLERVVESLACGHQRLGHRVSVAVVVVPGQAEPSLVATLRAGGVDVRILSIPARGYARERAAIGECCDTLRPDVVHTHGYRSDVIDAGVARRHGIPVVTTAHGFTRGRWINRLYERLQRRAFRRFDAVVAVSRPLAEQLIRGGVARERVHVVPNAWGGSVTFTGRADARRALGLPGTGFQIGWVGRLMPEKGPDVMLGAMALLSDLPVTVVMVGDGPMRLALQEDANRLRVADRCRWPGLVHDAATLFSAFDLFVLSSRTEGTPIVLFEAMAAGLPVVATRVGGVPDVISDAEAVLVPADNPGALAQAVRGVLADPVAAQRRVAAARKRLESKFAVGPWLARYAALYGELVQAGVVA